MALLPLLALAWYALGTVLRSPWRKLARGLLALFLLFGAERAAAQDCGAACVFAGPRLASVESSESPLLAPILGGLLGTDISVSVLDWNAIANADLDLLGILGGLGQDITVSDPSQVANIDVTLLELVQASAAVAAADGDTALVNALNALSIPIAELNGTINLADLITIGLPQGALAEIDLNALDLIGGAIQLYNYENVLTTTEPVAIHSDALQAFGIGGAEILLQIIEPPHFECGGAGTQFHTATIRAKLTIDLANLALDTSVLDMTLGGLLGGLVSTSIALADIDLYLEVGRVDGQILSADPATKTASILLSTSSIDLYAGSIDDALFFNRSRPVQPSDIGFGTIGQLSVSLFGGLIQESAGIRATAFAQSAQGAGETLFFAPPYPQRQAIGDGASSFSTLVGTLAQNLDIEVEDTLGNLVGPLIDSTVEPLVNNLVGGLFLDVISPLLDVTVDPLLAFLGVGIGEAEAAVTSVISICSDYSDCPLSGLAPDGVSTADYGSAGHFIIDSLYMGSLAPDGEGGAQPNATATGDDETGTDDEDGVTIPPLYPGATRTIDISVTQSGGETGYLQGWIDWNGDGSFTASERVAHDATLTSGDTISLSVTVPANARIGSSFARFRWSTEPGLSPVGLAPDGEVEDLAVAIAGQPYALMSGRMMSDTGRGGGTAHDAQQNGTETGVPGVLVQVETLAGSVLSSAISNASGDWSVGVPEGYEGPVLLRAVPPTGSLAISEITSGPAELVATDPSDGVMQLNLTASSAPSGLNFGIVPEPTLSEASTTYAEAGQVATLSHDYVAGSAGDVTFSVLNLESLALDMASVTLFRDIDCNGVPDILLPGSTSVEEGDRICLVSRVPTSSALPDGAEIAYDLLAVTTFRSSSRQHSTQNSDRVVIGKETGGLVIEKSVENLSRMTGQSRSNSGGPGDVLLYRLNLSNPSAEPVTDVSVFDATPAYTTLEGTITESLLMGNGTECTLTLPDVAAAGYAGELRWDCVGPVLPGATAELEFAVRISD